MAIHWIMVGDAAGARVFESEDARMEVLTLVDELTKAGDHVKRLNGVGMDDLPGAGPDAAAAHQDPHKVGEERFARAVAQVLLEADGKHRFEHLVVAAPPHFLGEFRAAASAGVLKRVVASFHHDWTKLSSKDLADRVRKGLPDTGSSR